MVTLDTKLELAKALFGKQRRDGKTLGGTSTIKGTVMADSSDGSVSVMVGEPDGSTTAADLTADMPIIGSATTGDEVDIIVQDGIPTAIAAPGWGDSIEGKVQYITFVSTPPDAGLHIHENATSYNTAGDLWLNSGAVEIRDNGTTTASFSTAGLEFLQTIFLKVVTGVLGTSAFFGKKNSNDDTCGLQIDDRGQVSVSLVGDAVNLDVPNATGIPGAALGCNGNFLFAWYEVTTSSGTTSKTIDLTGASEVMVVADLTRNGALHTFANSFPIQALGNSAHEYKIGGYVGTSGTTGGAWCSMSLTSFAGVGACINGTSFISATTWTVYAR